MLFGNLLKKKKKEISKALFGERVLSRMLLTSGKKCPELLEELGANVSFTNYLLYLQYHLFLAGKILEQRYTVADVELISNATINGLIDFIDSIPSDKKVEAKKMLHEMYQEVSDCAEEICSDFGSENGLKSLADAFIEDCGASKGLSSNMLVFTHFSEFIIYHTSDVLNDEIVLV